jgi:diguanylate cyclase (GGDEF)-like protein/PAS domain S-box-containing protein
MAQNELPTFDEAEQEETDSTGPVFTETIDLGELDPVDSGFRESYDQTTGIPESVRKLLHSLPSPALVVGRGKTIIFLNQSWRKITKGYKIVRGHNILKLFPREVDSEKVRVLMQDVFLYRTPRACEGILEIDRTKIWCRLNMRSIRFGRERAVLGIIEDLTLEKKQLLLQRRHKKELQAARDQLEKRVQERTAEIRETNERLRQEIFVRKKAEHRLRQAHDELEQRVEARTAELSHANKKLQLEVAERKRAQEKLILAGKVIQGCNEAIAITDRENKIVDVNDAFCKITGYSWVDSSGQDPADLLGEIRDKEVLEEIWDAVSEEGQWQGEIVHQRRNGELYPALLSVSAVLNDAKQVTHYVRIFSDITRLKQTEKRLEHLAHYDGLTSLPNRVLFQDRLQQAMYQAARNNLIVVLMLLDLDGFKSVNDTFGHAAGDDLLIAVADRLKKCVRSTDTVARLGGDEFTVVLTGVTDVRGAASVATQINRVLSEPFVINGRELFISASIGITTYPLDSDQPERLLQNADTALYHAKEQGRNNFQFFSEEMNIRVLERLALELDLRAALERREFVLYYQPLVSIATGEVVSAEALIRWNHPTRGLLLPDKFIPSAEETGLILPIGEWVIRAACEQNRAWAEQGYATIPVSVNVSGLQLRQQDLVEKILKMLEDIDLEPRFLELELTERFAEGDPTETAKLFHEIKRNGISISIDDFGTGYSSLNVLKQFPIDKLKIDRSFIHDIPDDQDNAGIVEAIVSVAHGLKLKVVAEGVETEEQLEFLRERKCDTWQGHLLTKPVPADELVRFLRPGPVPVIKQAPQVSETTATHFERMADRLMLGLNGHGSLITVDPPGVYTFRGRRSPHSW